MTRLNMRSLLLTALAFCASSWASGQIFTITQGSVTTCTGALLDSGGEGSSGYSNNENYTLTICPDGGDAISLQWITFNLSTAGVTPLDQISIYDGDGVDDPLIGSWTGNDGSPGIVSASFDNPTGCLTVVFTSNNTGTGIFAAAITCYQPCEPPTASATANGLTTVPLLVCQNEVITFNGSASTAAEGFTVSGFEWDFADGQLDSTSGAITSHSFPEAGEYVVQLTVTDDNECVNTNVIDLQILVSTTPLFTGTTGDMTICQGDTAFLTAVATGVEWSALPESNLGSGIFLPDDTGVPFSTSISFNNFDPGQTLQDANDLLSICVDMEHSFMGDIVISLTCPNGQNMIFHQQGGGGTYLGVPVDDDNQPTVQGECWNYCWSPTATNGTWVENATGTLPSGTYESLQPFTNLVGCPLNGTWTFTVVDLWSIDNGFLCNWAMDFDPSLFPSLTEFTPILGVTSADSAQWAGNGFVTDPTDPLNGFTSPTDPGVYDYVFSITDNFGCTYDTTITVTVTPSPQAPITITGDEVICEDGIAYLVAPAGFDTYVWNPGNATGTNVNVQSGTYTVTVAYGNCPLTSDPFTVSLAPNPQPVITGPQFSCGGVPVTLTTEDPYVSYTWSNNSQAPSISVGSGSWFVTVTNEFGCSGTSASYPVTVAQDPVAAFGTDPVSPQPITTTVDFTDASSTSGGNIESWFWNFDDEGNTSSSQNPSYTFNDPGTYEVLLVVTTADGCVDSTIVNYVIFPPDILIPNVFTPNGDDLNETFAIENLEFYKHELRIYSRWGTLVHESTNASRAWRAGDQPDGTYYYVLTLGDGREMAGHVTVLR